jgi:hypothetical protein
MSTTKTVKIQKNKILTYSINKTGFQTVNKSIVVSQDATLTETMVSQSSSPILELGDRFLDISSFVCYFTPSGTYDVDSLKYISGTQTAGTDLGIITVSKELWLAQVETALSVETPKGTSNSFIFTYNGTDWDLTGATTQSGISTANLNNVYGVNYTGSATSGDVITVVETQYNKFAVYVLDSNYRSNQSWGVTGVVMPVTYDLSSGTCLESATYFNDYVKDNLSISNYPQFNYCKNKGNFILSNGIKINALVPNNSELKEIWNNRIILDSFDPIIQGGSTSFNLTNWNFTNDYCFTCLQSDWQTACTLKNDGTWGGYDASKIVYSWGCCPVFEVPVM